MAHSQIQVDADGKFRALRQKLENLTKAHQLACQEFTAADKESKLAVLRKANVVGMTTTAAARLHDIILELKTEIVIVEEAAEVLESHILGCITPHTQHVVLVGDHLQLRPSVAPHELATEHKLDVSMFERLVRGGIEHVTLQVQRRMKPCISKLISSLYPNLRDHTSVSAYEDVKGLRSSLFFLNHRAPESSSGTSKLNAKEAGLIVGLCSYLLKQESYEAEDITVLATYKAQVEEITRRLQQKSWESFPRVTTVDDYQGEENRIVLLSLVRNVNNSLHGYQQMNQEALAF